jgi:hypothetical protein
MVSQSREDGAVTASLTLRQCVLCILLTPAASLLWKLIDSIYV